MKTLKPGEYVQQYGQDSYQELLQSHPDVQAVQKPNVFQRIGNVINQAGSNVADAITGQGEFAGQGTIRRATGAVASAFNAVPGVAIAALPQPVGNAINKGTTNLLDWFANNAGKNPFGGKNQQGLVDNPIFQNFANSKAGQGTAEVAGTVSNLGQISGDILAADQVAKGAQTSVDTAKNLTNKTVSGIKTTIGKVTGNVPQGTPFDEAKVLDQYNRAIRPTVAGKTNATQIAKGNSNTISAIKAIGENKDNLTLTDAHGEILQGQLPKSVDQFAQAITQTKKSLFQQYDSLAKQAGEQGVTVDSVNIATELQPVIDSKSLRIANPRAVEYATNLQQRLLDAGQIDAQTVQDIIQHYNDSLQAFYKNPNYETASTASVDALVANKFRTLLDKGIEGATGQQYQALKNAYGALSSIEKDVAHRNIVWGRQNAVGLASNLANLGSGAELVRGLIKLNPADLAASATIKGIQKYIQYLNNPDVGVSKIFSSLEKSSPASTVGNLPTEGTGKGGSSSSNFTTKAVKSQPIPQVPDTTAPITIPQDDLNVMSDFTDYVAKSYKLPKAAAQKLELDASRIAQRYGIKIGKTNQSIANAFGKVLEKQGFKK